MHLLSLILIGMVVHQHKFKILLHIFVVTGPLGFSTTALKAIC